MKHWVQQWWCDVLFSSHRMDTTITITYHRPIANTNFLLIQVEYLWKRDGSQFACFFGTPRRCRKSSSIRGSPSRSVILGSHPSSSFVFVMSGFLCRGSSGVFSTIFKGTSGSINWSIKWYHCKTLTLMNTVISTRTGKHDKAYLFHCFCKFHHCKLACTKQNIKQ